MPVLKKHTQKNKNFRNNDEESASTNEKEMGKIVRMTILAYPCYGRQM